VSSLLRYAGRSYLLTTLGAKKEFNYWGGPAWNWGLKWYTGASIPLVAWEWRLPLAAWGQRTRGGEEPQQLIRQLCLLRNESDLRQKRWPWSDQHGDTNACSRFPLQCIAGEQLVRDGCGIMRPLPSWQRCGHTHEPKCAPVHLFVSHAWPRSAEISSQALTVDPSINTFMNFPDAPRLLAAALAPKSQFRFIVLVREPVERAVSSTRMMLEWRWERGSNYSSILSRDAHAFRRCFETNPAARAAVATACSRAATPQHLGHISDGLLTCWADGAAQSVAQATDTQLVQLRRCLADGHPRNHVRAGAYAVAATAWLRRFSPEQFLWLETAAMRQMSEIAILTMLGDFLCLPTAHLRNAPGEVLHACKSPSAGKMGQVDQRMKTHALESLVPADFAQRLTSVYRPFNRLLASILSFRKFEKTTAQTVLSAPWLRA